MILKSLTLAATLVAALGTTALFSVPSNALSESASNIASPEAKADIVDTAVSAGDFNTLVAAVQAAGLVDVLKGDGPFTVFAPTDAAFAALPEGTVENLLKPENLPTLQKILTYHVVPGKVLSGDLAGKALDADTAAGAKLAIDARSGGVKVGEASVVAADIETSNGVIHVIDAVLIPAE